MWSLLWESHEKQPTRVQGSQRWMLGIQRRSEYLHRLNLDLCSVYIRRTTGMWLPSLGWDSKITEVVCTMDTYLGHSPTGCPSGAMSQICVQLYSVQLTHHAASARKNKTQQTRFSRRRSFSNVLPVTFCAADKV